jgi:hypothetical protein
MADCTGACHRDAALRDPGGLPSAPTRCRLTGKKKCGLIRTCGDIPGCIVKGCRITFATSPARQDNTGGLDAEIVSYCSGRSGVRLRADSFLDGPKHPQYRSRDCYSASTDTGAHCNGPDCAGLHGNGAHDDGTRRHGTGLRTRRHGARYDHDRAHDQEKEVCEDDTAAGDR